MIPRRSSGSNRTDKAVEPTRSQNITVSCRRSAASCGLAPVDAEGAADVPVNIPAAAKPEMALRRRLRCPSGTLSFSRSASVSSGRISASILLARNSASYSPRPRLLSQPPTSMAALHGPERIILRLKRPVQGRAVEARGWARSGNPAKVGLGTAPSMVYASSLAPRRDGQPEEDENRPVQSQDVFVI